MQLEPARTENIVMDRSLWGGHVCLQVERRTDDATQLGQLVHARKLKEHYFLVYNRRGNDLKFSEEYRSLAEFIAAGWRAS